MHRLPPRQPWFSILFAAALLCLAFAPVVSAMAAIAVADAHDCRLDEGGFYPCVVAGHDVGALIGTMAIAAWLFLVTQPLAIAIASGWLVVLALKRAVTHYKKGRHNLTPTG
ncbi:hypothetical protein [Martelella sp. HB161492]|uniref:hypothetical protein n=1 Tax=Martelella sp. HB161492 TaxID=2720726 RepID=UPI001591944C|nr:hypothetical protein [Martelella sp. HB161492]